jgi:hypothetical protein
MAKTVLDVLNDRINEDKTSALEFIGAGGAKDFPQYKEATGFIRGLETCLNYVNDLSRNQMEDDDDD